MERTANSQMARAKIKRSCPKAASGRLFLFLRILVLALLPAFFNKGQDIIMQNSRIRSKNYKHKNSAKKGHKYSSKFICSQISGGGSTEPGSKPSNGSATGMGLSSPMEYSAPYQTKGKVQSSVCTMPVLQKS